MSFLSKIKHPTLTEKPMEIKVELQKLSFQVALDTLSAKARQDLTGMDAYVEWKRGKTKRYSKPYPFDLASGVLQGRSNYTRYELILDDEFSTVSEVRWNKKGLIQPKKCDFKVFLQARDPKKKELSKKGGVIIAERDFDLAPYVTE